MRLKNWIIWYRQDGWKGNNGFAQSHEHILYFIKDNTLVFDWRSSDSTSGASGWKQGARHKRPYACDGPVQESQKKGWQRRLFFGGWMVREWKEAAFAARTHST